MSEFFNRRLLSDCGLAFIFAFAVFANAGQHGTGTVVTTFSTSVATLVDRGWLILNSVLFSKSLTYSIHALIGLYLSSWVFMLVVGIGYWLRRRQAILTFRRINASLLNNSRRTSLLASNLRQASDIKRTGQRSLRIGMRRRPRSHMSP